MIRHILTLMWNKRGQNALLMAEISIAFLILFAVFVFVIQNLTRYQSPLGFDTENVWMISMEWDDNMDSATYVDTKRRLMSELAQLPEVAALSYHSWIQPFGGAMWNTEGNMNGVRVWSAIQQADEHFVATAGLELSAGRDFVPEDRQSRYRAVLINEQLHREFLGGAPILDSLLEVDGENVVVGIVKHYKYRGEFEPEYPMTFFFKPWESRDLPNLLIRTKPGAGAAFEEAANQIITQVTRRSDFNIDHLDQRRRRTSRQTWVPIVAFLSIAGFLVLNVALGLFGVLWYNINRRRAEVGLRRSIGATPRGIALQFMGEILAMALLGLAIGLTFAVQLPIMGVEMVEDQRIFYQAMFAAAAAIFVLVLLCTIYPSWQATRISPALALHED